VSIVLLGKKLGMTRIFNAVGDMVPVTVIELKPATVLSKKTSDKDGYEALRLAFGEVKENRMKKPVIGQFKKADMAPKKYIRESRVDNSVLDQYKPGDVIESSFFSKDDFIDVSGTSIGKGFAGVIKRWHFSGGKKTHGSMFHRAPGSIGASASPSRVFKGKKLPGRMGATRVTIQNLQIVEIKENDNIILVKGAIPGSRGGIVELRKAKKKAGAGK